MMPERHPPCWRVLEDTRVEQMLGRVLLAGGLDVDEVNLDEIVLWSPEEEEAESSGDSEEEEGPPPPPRMYFSFILLFCLGGGGGFFPFLLSGGRWWERDSGCLTMAAQAGPRL